MKRRRFRLDQAVFIVSFLFDVGLILYTTRQVRARGFSDLTSPVLFLVPSLIPGTLFLFFGIRSLIETRQILLEEGTGGVQVDEPGNLLRSEVTLLIYGSVLLFATFGGAVACINLVVSR